MTNAFFKSLKKPIGDGGVYSFSKSGSVAQAADVLPVPITHSFVTKSLGADAEALTLANGEEGQELTVYLGVQASSGAGTITPVTSTGWSTVVLDDVGDVVSFKYIDDSVGWIIKGASGLTAQPTIT